MSAKEIARSGLLAAAAVALLYIGGAAPYLGPAACIVAGVTSAVPLLRRARVRTAVLLYIAAALLGRADRAAQERGRGVRAADRPVSDRQVRGGGPPAASGADRRQAGLFQSGACRSRCSGGVRPVPEVALPGFARLAMLWLAANFGFMIYDVALSRLIAMLRRSLPPD